MKSYLIEIKKKKKQFTPKKKHLNDNRIICAKKKIVCKSTHNIQVRLVKKMFWWISLVFVQYLNDDFMAPTKHQINDKHQLKDNNNLIFFFSFIFISFDT